MPRALRTLIVAAVAVLGGPVCGSDSDCRARPTVVHLSYGSSLVFAGEVLEIEAFVEEQRWYRKVRFRVCEVWKGDIEESVTVYRVIDDRIRGGFEVGGNYLVFGVLSSGHTPLVVDRCYGSTRLREEDDISGWLGELGEPVTAYCEMD